MSRFTLDCRDVPSESNCSLAMSADSQEELLEAGVHHAIQVHGHQDSPELRGELQKGIKEGIPAV